MVIHVVAEKVSDVNIRHNIHIYNKQNPRQTNGTRRKGTLSGPKQS